MLENFKTNYFYSTQGFRILYHTNFKSSDLLNDDRVLVFNYGLVCSNSHWEKQIPFFHALGYKILLHDYRFHFSSSSSDSIDDCNFKGIINDLHDLMNELKISNSIMIGHSMGVNITLEYAYRYPERVDSMILISGTVLPPQDIMFDTNTMELITPYIEWFSNTYPKIHEKLWTTSYLNPVIRFMVRKGGFNMEKVPDEFIQIYMKRIGELSPDIFLKLLNEMKEHDIAGRLSAIKVKALVIGGDKDQVIPNYLQDILIDRLENSELYIVKDGSHVPQADFPESINQRIFQFIEK
tara:strand:- start:275691 stop:276575 length:885 start_codon:yes stop_codon:yes gene_type:complete